MHPGIYNASKAALIAASEGWRLELAPLGVRVITLITGGIATNFLTNLQTVELPEDSYYICVKDVIERQPNSTGMMKPELFAIEVLSQVEQGGTGKFWIGTGSVIARLALWLCPQGVLVSNLLMRHAILCPNRC
jgi:1-acylglycerone phosphate reductase